MRLLYPFAAVVGQGEMKLALLLAAVDWRLGVLLRGDKGSGKTTTARALAALLPGPAPFINLPIGATEDRLLGGLHLERTLKGDPVLKPGLLSEADGGVLYVDEVNLLPAHLGDALLDVAASGVLVLEREGLSANHRAEFVLLGSMNPEEGTLRPQLTDRFALSVTVAAPSDARERERVLERRLAFDRDPASFAQEWRSAQEELQQQIVMARMHLTQIDCSGERLKQITEAVCASGVRSLRADLALARAAIAYAALEGHATVATEHIEAVLPLVLAHRMREGSRRPPSSPPPPLAEQSSGAPDPQSDQATDGQEAKERVFALDEVTTSGIRPPVVKASAQGESARSNACGSGPVVGSRQTEDPVELDVRATLLQNVREAGGLKLRLADLQERVRTQVASTRYLFVIDSSGSHAAQQRMRSVKGAIAGLLTRSFKHGDEVAMIVFRGTSAQVILEPTKMLADGMSSLEYLPTGGRTPLAAGLACARDYLTPSTILVLLTDGRANVAIAQGDPWQEAISVVEQMECNAIVIDTDRADTAGGAHALNRCSELAEALNARYLTLGDVLQGEMISAGR